VAAVVARARSRSAAFRASCFLVSISWISLRLIDPPELFFLSSSIDQTGFMDTDTADVGGVVSFTGWATGGVNGAETFGCSGFVCTENLRLGLVGCCDVSEGLVMEGF
jgi:hypothetical protein